MPRLPLNEDTKHLYPFFCAAAMIIDYRDCCMREPSFGCQWIMWYGDYKLSQVKMIVPREKSERYKILEICTVF